MGTLHFLNLMNLNKMLDNGNLMDSDQWFFVTERKTVLSRYITQVKPVSDSKELPFLNC